MGGLGLWVGGRDTSEWWEAPMVNELLNSEDQWITLPLILDLPCNSFEFDMHMYSDHIVEGVGAPRLSHQTCNSLHNPCSTSPRRKLGNQFCLMPL